MISCVSNQNRVFAVMAMVLTFLTFQPSWADGGADHRAAQAWPIDLGTSGGNINDRSRIYCCSGTLGALVEDAAGVQYILSNNHVLARTNLGIIGDDVNQPGMIDQNCARLGIVADLSSFVPIKFKAKTSIPLNEVDAAKALARTGAVSSDGWILDIGPVSANTVSAFVGQALQKSGRTTGYTTGTVAATNVTVDVGYSKSCGGANNQVARFINQIRISSSTFSAGGDSGSLVAEANDVDPTDGLPRAVGLLFAGSSTSTLLNPIDRVLALLNVSMVNGSVAAKSAATTKAINRAAAVKSRHSDSLFAVRGTVGHGVGASASGKPVIEVYIAEDSPLAHAQVPSSIEGIPVRIVVTGPFEAF